MNSKFKRGDFFIYKKDQVGICGRVNGVLSDMVEYEIIRDFGMKPDDGMGFSVGSKFYRSSRIITEEEALAYAI